MKHSKKSCYNWHNFNKKTFAQKQQIGLKIIRDFILVSRHTEQLHALFNGPKDNPVISHLEEEYSGVFTLFDLCQITDENHRNALLQILHHEINADENATQLATRIAALWRAKLTQLAKEKEGAA